MGLQAIIKTNKGNIKIDLFEDKAPITVANFVNLALRGFYDDMIVHRFEKNFMVQIGCPNGRGDGDAGYKFNDEFHSSLRHDKIGTVSMANAGPDTNGSQFFISHIPTPELDDLHSVFGRVVNEMSQGVADSLRKGDHVFQVVIKGEYDSLFERTAEYLEKWNKILDKETL